MCITKVELKSKVDEIREYKAIAEEMKEIIESLEAEVISYMKENKLDKEVTDNATITYKPQTRKSLDKDKLESDFGDLTAYTKATTYSVLRIK